MNLTLDQFFDGLERSVRELPGVLSEWEELESELRDEYADQLLWLLRSRADVLARAAREERYLEFVQRMVNATVAMLHLRDEIRDALGISVDEIVPDVTFIDTDDDAPIAQDEWPLALAV
jgi:hypothetical protein